MFLSRKWSEITKPFFSWFIIRENSENHEACMKTVGIYYLRAWGATRHGRFKKKRYTRVCPDAPTPEKNRVHHSSVLRTSISLSRTVPNYSLPFPPFPSFSGKHVPEGIPLATCEVTSCRWSYTRTPKRFLTWTRSAPVRAIIHLLILWWWWSSTHGVWSDGKQIWNLQLSRPHLTPSLGYCGG